MKSYLSIYGPPVLKAIKALEKVAIDSPEICIMDTVIEMSRTRFDDLDSVYSYFSTMGDLDRERCGNIISKSGETLGEYDFYFEWFTEPTMEQLYSLIEKVDEALAPLGCKYKITTK